MTLNIVTLVSHSKIPRWKLIKPVIDTSLSEIKKTETNISRRDSKQTGIENYTDGSRDKNKVAAAAVINKDVYMGTMKQIRMQNPHSTYKL